MKTSDFIDLYVRCKAQGLRSIRLVMDKKLGWRPKGYGVKTPFGIGEILSVQDHKNEDKTTVVFAVELAKVTKWIKKETREAVKV